MGTSTGADVPLIRLLGTVELDGSATTSLAPRERALLARLAMARGRTVPVDRLVDDLWADRPPATSRNALQVYVSHLRARLGREAVVATGGGYRLEVPPDRIDAHDYERLLAVALGLSSSGDAAGAVEALDTATALWRGQPLADLTAYEFARTEAARLTDLRGSSLEHLAEALLGLDRLDRLADELAPLVRDFPFRERLRAAVMMGYYRQGRAVDALALYAEAVDLLREELGLEPGPALKALHHAILNDDPTLGASLPTGELTLLATVLEGAAALEGELGEAYGDALLTHRELLRHVFAAHGGLALPTGGERTLTVFPSAHEAVLAAAEAQRDLAGHRVARDVQVRIRVGVHTGVPRVVEQHYVGTDVHRVTQVALAAAGGQTLVTADTTQLLVPEALSDAGLGLSDLGHHRLVDVVTPVHLHQLDVAGLARPVAAPRSLGGRSNLPRRVVPFIGRDAELAVLVDEVARPGRGLSTVLGPGGAGKTRLAVEVADRVGTTFAGGVYFVALETSTMPVGLWDAVGSALGVPADARGATAVLAHLTGRRTLLVLDNLEQIPDAGVAIEQVLAVDGAVRVLATSRRPTGVRGERLHHLHPLAGGPGRVEAARLFASYAELARPGFVLDDDNRSDVERICRRVDGLPLGIELAAARVKQLSPHTLADMLESGHDLVVGGPSRPDRQRDLHALTDWSFQLLEPHQQHLLELVSVFVGGVDLDTVARLRPADGPDPVTIALELADASLVRISDDELARVTLLETVREYAVGRLRASGREEGCRDAHLQAYVELARRLHPRVAGRTKITDTLARERGNVEAALDWALATPGRAEAAAEILVNLGEEWHQLGARAFDYIERTMAACPDPSPFLGWMSYWDYRRRWDTEVDDHLLMDLMIDVESGLRAAGDPAPLAALLAYGNNLGPHTGADASWGVDRAREAVDLATALEDDWLLGVASSSLATSLIEAGRPDEAPGPLDQARAAAARRGDVDRLDELSMTEALVVALDGRRAEAWALAVPAASGLVAGRSEGTRWRACFRLAQLTAHERPAASAALLGIALGSLDRMDSRPGLLDLEQIRENVRAAQDALGSVEFDRLLDDGRSWPTPVAVAWVLDLLEDTTPA